MRAGSAPGLPLLLLLLACQLGLHAGYQVGGPVGWMESLRASAHANCRDWLVAARHLPCALQASNWHQTTCCWAIPSPTAQRVCCVQDQPSPSPRPAAAAGVVTASSTPYTGKHCTPSLLDVAKQLNQLEVLVQLQKVGYSLFVADQNRPITVLAPRGAALQQLASGGSPGAVGGRR